MKKYILGLAFIASLTSTTLAADALATSMADMRTGLQSIQDGFSYNNKDGILTGIAKVQQANEIFHNQKSAGQYLPKDKQKFARVSYLSAKTLNRSLEQMKEYVEINKIVEASENMAGVVHSCTRCHAIVRGW